MERELRPLLSQWATVEPKRCCQRADFSFDVEYLGHWIAVSAQPISHGSIIASVLAGCQENNIHCEIDYTPRYEQEQATVEVGCIPNLSLEPRRGNHLVDPNSATARVS